MKRVYFSVLIIILYITLVFVFLRIYYPNSPNTKKDCIEQFTAMNNELLKCGIASIDQSESCFDLSNRATWYGRYCTNK